MTTTYHRQQQPRGGGPCYHTSVHHLHYHQRSSTVAHLSCAVVDSTCSGSSGVNASAVDDLICESAIAKALSERGIFGSFSFPIVIHMPPPRKHSHHRSRCRPQLSSSSSKPFWSAFVDDHDPLQATSRDPWDSHCEETMEEKEQEEKVKQESTKTMTTTTTTVSSSDDYHHHPYSFVHHYQQHQHAHNSNVQSSNPHIFYDPGRTDMMDHDQLHRRASTISDAITTSSTEISRRFSNTSSILTDASSVEAEEDKEQDEKEEEWQPVWADPARVRDNPSRYERVQAYMKQHGIAPDSPMPLSSAYTFYFWDSSQKSPSTSTSASHYMEAVKPIFDCKTVWDFSSRWRLYKALRGRPSQMAPNQNLYCFVKGVQPMWEDVRNRRGGRLTLSPARSDLDEVFEWVLASFVGGNLESYAMVGLVLSRRTRGDRVELWLERTVPEDVPGLK
ncbi:translation initiation factor eIF 4e-like domain-containing protein [Dichotomocladium elegans]|nr:translation initiation factor eIF 4e-like domain-containing protein [Dichotomocladium elegans]